MLYIYIRLGLLCGRTSSSFGMYAREAALASVLFSLTKDVKLYLYNSSTAERLNKCLIWVLSDILAICVYH